ncbi:CWC16 protein [Phialemonium atrogriseum]|uniref:CWC16 protein n=1 Tax=Phialemonium atrogriseum TaxID=1093897 RepID=A0AAJ0C079_9PEZI|nr:CWC16 protein [Phialemonium atrogriseum]KAK1767724.1 CWC16 protein [Phialemonium atrogriseum]
MQGFNMGRYVPPDQEGVMSGNRLHGKHPLGSRASRLPADGSLTVRFEMPFAIWCAGCPKPTLIGQGVRFNAAKRRVGSYHSTPIFSFRMRHADCGADIEIRTDPRNTAYEVVSGARRREDARPEPGDSLVGDSSFGVGEGGAGAGAIVTEAERRDGRERAFAKLERTIEDRARVAVATERIGELRDAAARQWEDPYARNRRLRRAFREGRRAREGEAARAEDLRDRMSLGIELVAAREEDTVRARLVDFGTVPEEEEEGDGTVIGDGAGRGRVDEALARPLFGVRAGEAELGRGREPERPMAKMKGKLKSELAASKRRESLVSEVVGNTRAAKDPFLAFGSKEVSKTPTRLPGIIRKRRAEDGPDPPEGEPPMMKMATSSLVSYDSD